MVQQLQFHEFGSPGEVLQLTETESKPLQDGEVRLRTLASPINPADTLLILGHYGIRPPLPSNGGMEGCAEVVESKFPGIAPKMKVIALRPIRFWTSEIVLPGSQLFVLPEEIDPLQAAMLRVNPATAWCMLHQFIQLTPGDWIVQNAANSGVGRYTIQLCKHLGLRSINLVRRESLFAELKDIGADHVLLDDDSAVEQAREIMGGAKATLALNAVGGESAKRLLNMLQMGGQHITYGIMSGKPIELSGADMIFRKLSLHGFWVTQWLKENPEEKLREMYKTLSELMAEGKLHVPIDATYSLAEYKSAFQCLREPERHGKILFTPTNA